MMAYAIAAGDIVVANTAYEVVVGGTFELLDFVSCRRVIDTNGPICAFLAASVLGLDEGDAA
jgi:hypothetical protein